MQTLNNIQQGTPEWLAIRAKHFTASEAPAMMGASKYVTRAELLRQKATGDTPEINATTQALFDQGHHAEAQARPIAEKIVGEELYPATAIDDDGYLLASFDGVTLTEEVIWEHKLWNEGLATQIKNKELDPHYYWQLEQQLLISKANGCLFMTSDGTADKCEYFWYKPLSGRAEQLLAGWKQFEDDLENYQHVETKPEPVGRSPDALPALRIELNGMVTNSNLTEFTAHALSVFGNIKTDLQTDKDFSNAEKTVKWCKEVETKLAAAKQNALSQTASIDELFRAIDSISEEARTVRLDLEKSVKSRKIAVRSEILQKGKDVLNKHIETINSTLGKLNLPSIDSDFAVAMKGKKTVTSLVSAVDDELARAKIEASRIGDKMRINLETLRAKAKDYEFLFVDAQQLVMKENDDLINLIATRIAEHKKAEEEKAAAALREAQEKLDAEAEGKSVPTGSQIKYVEPFVSENSHRGYGGGGSRPATNIIPKSSELSFDDHRPADSDIITVLSAHYRVNEDKVIEWLVDMNLDNAIERIVV